MTVENNPALVMGAGIFNNKKGDEMAAKKKYLNISEFPYVIDGEPKAPGEFFETEPSVNIQQLVGADPSRAQEVTKENEAVLKEAAAKMKAAYIERSTPKKKV